MQESPWLLFVIIGLSLLSSLYERFKKMQQNRPEVDPEKVPSPAEFDIEKELRKILQPLEKAPAPPTAAAPAGQPEKQPEKKVLPAEDHKSHREERKVIFAEKTEPHKGPVLKNKKPDSYYDNSPSESELFEKQRRIFTAGKQTKEQKITPPVFIPKEITSAPVLGLEPEVTPAPFHVDVQKAREGIIWKEILGPSKGSQYFSNRFKR